MSLHILKLFLILLVLGGCYTYDFKVETSQGTVKGDFYKNGELNYNHFTGIPYAETPINKNRFVRPKERNFQYINSNPKPNKCVQPSSTISPGTGNEDCLYLSVFTPSVPTSERHRDLKYPKYPVMVWFHDGNFSTGSGDYGGYWPDYLVNEKVVVVTVNFRLGAFGFLSFDDNVVSGNMGLKDQVQALKWVKKEIDKFGGDNSKITVIGSGSGAASIHYLILCESCRDLFHRAILQSGSAHNPWALQRQPVEEAIKLLKKVAIPKFDKAQTNVYLNLLQQSQGSQYSSENLLKSSIDIMNQKDKIRNLLLFRPVIENGESTDAVITKPLKESTKELSKSKSLQVIIGFNKDEGMNFANENIGVIYYTDQMLELFLPNDIKDKNNKEQCIQLLNKTYFDNFDKEDEKKAQFVNMVGDAHYIYGIYQTAKEFANAGITAYFYRFSYEDNDYTTSSYKNLRGVPHGAEYKYLFRPKDNYFGNEVKPLNPKDKEVQKKLLTMWKSFAENGNPTPDKLPAEWNKLGKGEPSYLDIGETLTMKTMEEQSRMKTWDEIMAKCKN